MRKRYSEGKAYKHTKASSSNSGGGKKKKISAADKKNLPPQREVVLWVRPGKGKKVFVDKSKFD